MGPGLPSPEDHKDSSCSRSEVGGGGGAPRGPRGPLGGYEAAGGHHSTAGHSSCSPQLPDPVAVRSRSEVHTYYRSPSLGTFPLAQPSDESRFDQSALGIPGQKAPLAMARRDQEALGPPGLARGRERSQAQGQAPGWALEPVRVQDAAPPPLDTQLARGREVGAKGHNLWGASSLPWERGRVSWAVGVGEA